VVVVVVVRDTCDPERCPIPTTYPICWLAACTAPIGHTNAAIVTNWMIRNCAHSGEARVIISAARITPSKFWLFKKKATYMVMWRWAPTASYSGEATKWKAIAASISSCWLAPTLAAVHFPLVLSWEDKIRYQRKWLSKVCLNDARDCANIDPALSQNMLSFSDSGSHNGLSASECRIMLENTGVSKQEASWSWSCERHKFQMPWSTERVRIVMDRCRTAARFTRWPKERQPEPTDQKWGHQDQSGLHCQVSTLDR